MFTFEFKVMWVSNTFGCTDFEWETGKLNFKIFLSCKNFKRFQIFRKYKRLKRTKNSLQQKQTWNRLISAPSPIEARLKRLKKKLHKKKRAIFFFLNVTFSMKDFQFVNFPSFHLQSSFFNWIFYN